MTLQESIKYIKKMLLGKYPDQEIHSFVKIIFEHLLAFSFTGIHLNRNLLLTKAQSEKVKNIVSRLSKNEPVQYILGEAFFYDLKINVEPGVLIPRPETEELVDWIIKDWKDKEPEILDIGTGSGCIALALAMGIPEATVHAFDNSPKALEIAKKNNKGLKAGVNFFLADIFSSTFPVTIYDIIVSNPPYVLESQKKEMHENVLSHEPAEALYVADNNPLVYYSAIANFAKSRLKNGGCLYFEINESLGNETVQLLVEKGFKNINLKKDINNKDRMVKGNWRG